MAIHKAPSTATPAGARAATPDIYLYLGLLSLLVLTPGNVIFAPLQFLYKNQLHMNATEVGYFKLVVNGFGYVAFVFGFCRDRFSPLKRGDQGFFLVFGTLAALTMVLMAFMPLSRVTLALGLLLWGVATNLIGASYQAVLRNISEARRMSGRISTLYNVMGSLIGAAALLAGGQLIDHTTWRQQLLIVAGLSLGITGIGFWRVSDAFPDVNLGGGRSLADLREDLRKIKHHRGYWIALAIWAIWNFAPASLTPMMFYLTNTLKMSGTQFGTYNALFALAFIPTTLLFGFLCKKVRLWPLLLVATVLAIPQWVPVMFLHTPGQVYVGAIVMGLVGGLANAPYYGLLFRACPEGLAGSGMLLAASFVTVVAQFGNILGGAIYDHWGFTGCSLVTTGAYALIFPLLFLLPRALVNPKDDEHVPTEEELLAS